jgi:uncharacterized membrane protein YphA (DoxX/SURF4 family)
MQNGGSDSPETEPAEMSSVPAAARSSDFLRIALGLVYLHFGILKFFPDLSPAEMIASQTVMRLSLSWLDARTAMVVLALGECAIGLAFLFDVAMRWLPIVFLLHMVGTSLPLFILPELTFKIAPFAPTLEGQYIMKNLVFVAAAWTVLVPRLSWAGIPGLARRRRRQESPGLEQASQA